MPVSAPQKKSSSTPRATKARQPLASCNVNTPVNGKRKSHHGGSRDGAGRKKGSTAKKKKKEDQALANAARQAKFRRFKMLKEVRDKINPHRQGKLKTRDMNAMAVVVLISLLLTGLAMGVALDQASQVACMNRAHLAKVSKIVIASKGEEVPFTPMRKVLQDAEKVRALARLAAHPVPSSHTYSFAV